MANAAMKTLMGFLAFGCVLNALGQQSEDTDYYGVISAIPWDASASGPLIAPCPQSIVHGRTLEQIKRMEVPVGGLTAVVPTRMISLNTNFTAEPNLYDGLPQNAKVLYLLTLLSDDQWAKIGGKGLSLADCHGEQVAVMQSILPKPFDLGFGTKASAHGWLNQPGSETLSDQARSEVKLRISKRLSVNLSLVNNGGYTSSTVDDDTPMGAKIKFLKDNPDEFGQHFQVESDNSPRKSDLDFQNPKLGVKVALKTDEKLEALMARVAAATGLELYEDPHYAQERMVEIGQEATARDLLQAISLGVCGAYRRVGPAYVLTGDLAGIGSHELRLAAYEDDLDALVRDRENSWRSALYKAGDLKRIGYSQKAARDLGKEEIENAEANDKPDSDNVWMSTAKSSPAILQAMKDASFDQTKLDHTKVGVTSWALGQFVLPDGTVLHSTSWLGPLSQFTPNPWFSAPQPAAPVALPLKPGSSMSGFLLKASTPELGRQAVAIAEKFHVKQMWLESDDSATIEAAIMAGQMTEVEVHLVIRPWATSGSLQDPDRTLMGLSGKSLENAESNFQSYERFWQAIGAFPPPTSVQLAPLDAAIGSRWYGLGALAATPGLAGVVVLDAYPWGYALQDSNTHSVLDGPTEAFASYGYSEAQRLAFLRKYHVDPIDLQNNGSRTHSQLDEYWNGAWAGGLSHFEDWQKQKGQWARQAITSLAGAIGAHASRVLIQGQPPQSHLPPANRTFLSIWSPGANLPEARVDYDGAASAEDAEVWMVSMRETQDKDMENRVAGGLKKSFSQSAKPVVLDLSAVPLARADAFLQRWIGGS